MSVAVNPDDYTEYAVYTRDVLVMKGNTAVFKCDIQPAFVQPYVSVTSWYIDNRPATSGE